MLSGCGFLQTKSTPTITAKITISPEILKSCPKLEQIVTPDPQYEDIAAGYLTAISLYGQCALKQEASIRAIKQLANMEQPK